MVWKNGLAHMSGRETSTQPINQSIGEDDTGEHFSRQTGVRELIALRPGRQHLPLAVSLVRVEVHAVR